MVAPFLVPLFWGTLAGSTVGAFLAVKFTNFMGKKKTGENCEETQDSQRREEPSVDSVSDDEVENPSSPSPSSSRPQESVTWNDVAGLESAKASLIEATVFALKHPNLFTGERKKWKGILLYGPPGTGKTYLARAVATETNSAFFSISSSDIISKYYGQAEKKVRDLFQKARRATCSVIFIDEADGFFGQRTTDEKSCERTLKNEWLAQIDGQRYSNDNIIILAATNRPWDFDGAFRRRFEKRIFVPLPDEAARLQLLQNRAKKTEHTLTEDHLQGLAQQTERFSGHDVCILFNNALQSFIFEVMRGTHFRKVPNGQWTPCSPTHKDAQEMTWVNIPSNKIFDPPVGIAQFEIALEKTKPSVAIHELQQYLQFTAMFGEDA